MPGSPIKNALRRKLQTMIDSQKKKIRTVEVVRKLVMKEGKLIPGPLEHDVVKEKTLEHAAKIKL